MATLPSKAGAVTLNDFAKSIDPNGSVASTIELLSQTNEVLQDMTWIEGNLPTGHQSTVRTGIPVPTWRKLYGGVPPSKSTRAQVTDTCGFLEARNEIDVKVAGLNGNTAAFRMSEAMAEIEGMNQALGEALIYGDTAVNPERFTGLTPRYNSLAAVSGANIIDAGGTGSDNTSVWLVVWGENTITGIYPKGSSAGIQMHDKGQVTIENVDGAGGRMEGYRTHYRQDAGLTIRDWRYFVRIANIDVSDLTTVANTKNLINWMVSASERIPALGKGRACWYVNRNIREKLRIGILEKITNNLSWETVEGKRVMTFDDIPVRRTDALINTETLVA